MSQYSKIKEKINCCEFAYISCFSQCYENDKVIRFWDNQLIDMHNHNYTFIKKLTSKEDFKQLIEEQIEINIKENKDYCRFTMNELLDEKYLEGNNYKFEIEHYGQYAYIPMKTPEWEILNGCQIRKITNFSMIEDLITMI